MRTFFFVIGFVAFVLFVLAVGMCYSDNQELKSQLAYANERGEMLGERIERVVSSLPIEVVIDKGIVDMADQEFDILVKSIQKVADAPAIARRELGAVVAKNNKLAAKNARLEASYIDLAEICKNNLRAQEVFRTRSCDSEDFRRCLKVMHGEGVYNHGTKSCDAALDKRETCLKNGGITKYPTVIPSGT